MSIRKTLTLVVAFVLCFAVSVAAQSTDQSNPTPITSSELIISGPKKVNQQYYYSFTAGPGEVTLTLSVKAKSSSTFVGIKVFDAELNTVTYHNMSADTSPSMALKKFDMGEKQTLVLGFTSDSSLAECKIKFGGAVEFGASDPGNLSPGDNATTESTSTDPSSTSSSSDPSTITEVPPTTPSDSTGKNKSFTMSILDALGQRFNIPANGKLRIEMKDGSVQEIDLAQVKKILVKK